MVRLLWVVLLISGCKIYDPMIASCAVRCSDTGTCPTDLFCLDGFCKRDDAINVACTCKPGDVRSCQQTGLQCASDGVQICLPEFTWGACVYAVGPRSEQCNGLDDDCDGEIDEEATAGPACALNKGVCLGASQQCAGGQWNACDENRYGTLYERSEVSCDGRDNDCDGVIDQSAPVLITDQREGEVWLFGNPLVVVVNVDGGVLRATFDDELVVRSRTFLSGVVAIAASSNRVLTSGFEVRDFDGGVQRFDDVRRGALSDWELALAFTDGGITLFLEDGGSHELGDDDGGALRFSDHAAVLVFPGGLHQRESDAIFGSTGVGAASALIEKPTLIALPVAQPGDGRAPEVIFLGRLDRTPQSLFSFMLERLHDFQLSGTSFGSVVGALAVDGGVRLVDDLGVFTVQTRAPIETMRLVCTDDSHVILATVRGGEVELMRSCVK